MSSRISSFCCVAFLCLILFVNLVEGLPVMPSLLNAALEGIASMLVMVGFLFAEDVLESDDVRWQAALVIVCWSALAGAVTFVTLYLLFSFGMLDVFRFAYWIAWTTAVLMGVSVMFWRRAWGRVVVQVIIAMLALGLLLYVGLKPIGGIGLKFMLGWPLFGIAVILLLVPRDLDQ